MLTNREQSRNVNNVLRWVTPRLSTSNIVKCIVIVSILNIMRSRSSKSLPLSVKRCLKKLGSDLADARKRRRISTTTMAQRAMISRTTLVKVEKGDQGVSMGIYATVLFVLGMTERIADLADAAQDRTGLDLESENLPKRISSPRKKRNGTVNRGRE